MSARHGVPQGAADQSTRQLDQVLRQLVSVIGEQTAVARAALPQFFGVAELRVRWSCSHDQVIRHLRDYAGYVGETGVKPSVSLDDVLRIDAALLETYDARKRVVASRVVPLVTTETRTFRGVVAGREVTHAS